MYIEPEFKRRYPKVPLERRAYAFLLDFITVWLISSFFINFLQVIIFILTWFALRVILVEKNQGQSLGRWAFDLKIVDIRLNKIPGIVELAKREGIACPFALLAMYGLNIGFANPLSLLLLITPLLVDCSLVLADEEISQAFHDKIAGTIIVPTRRGFSLDLRLKKLWFAVKGKLKK